MAPDHRLYALRYVLASEVPTITELELQQSARDCAYRYQSTVAHILFDALKSRRTRLPPTAPASLEANTSPSPSPPHAADEI